MAVHDKLLRSRDDITAWVARAQKWGQARVTATLAASLEKNPMEEVVYLPHIQMVQKPR